ncbi:MAG: bifunctional phosphoribosyl-AMP cyclohydrolase/phosphoribosyl-ATP diphosphatase HisIE [Haliangiales bacterium]
MASQEHDISTLDDLRWDERGLLPAMVQDRGGDGVRMLGWMNQEALRATLATGFAHFYSRSRATLWKKGETSGNTLAVGEVRVDCDADAILLVAAPAGPTCHTGARSCFYRVIAPSAGAAAATDADASAIAARDDGPTAAPTAVLKELEQVIAARRDASTADKSYTRSLLDGGPAKIIAKIAEEQLELAEVLPNGDRADVIHECADLLFHVLVGLSGRHISIDEVCGELARRFGTSGHEEKASRGKGDGR